MSRSRAISVLLSALLLIGGLNLAAYAADGHPLLLGRTNVETSTATVHNTGHGPALRLTTRRGTPPLRVSSKVMIRHLNADRLDGHEGRDLGVSAWNYGVVGGAASTEVVMSFPNLPSARFLVRYRIYGSIAGSGGHLVCGFDEGQGGAVLSTLASGTALALDAWGPVDGRGPLTFRCTGDSAFDIGAGSVVTFLRVTRSSVQEAITTFH
jgi:hypothetical protein